MVKNSISMTTSDNLIPSYLGLELGAGFCKPLEIQNLFGTFLDFSSFFLLILSKQKTLSFDFNHLELKRSQILVSELNSIVVSSDGSWVSFNSKNSSRLMRKEAIIKKNNRKTRNKY